MNRNRALRVMILIFVLLLNLQLLTSTVLAEYQTRPSKDPQQPQGPRATEPTIQQSIADASPGATLQLTAGINTEILTINKPIHLKGQGPTQTILSTNSAANGHAIHITAPNVIISDLTIINTGPGLYTTGIKISASNTTIQNCSFAHTPIGIALWSSSNTITHCTFTGCDDEGIVLLGTSTRPCSDVTISSCLFTQNCDGIELQYASHNLITNCTFTKNTHAGIDAITANNNNNIIASCTFRDNAAFGIYLTKSQGNLITQCMFINDLITLTQAPNNTIHKSQATRINLFSHSSLYIDQCSGIDDANILSQQSTYELHPDKSPPIPPEKEPHRFSHLRSLFAILIRFKTLKILYDQLTQVRM